MPRYLVTLENNGEIVAGVYVEARNSQEARVKAQAYIQACKLVVWPRGS